MSLTRELIRLIHSKPMTAADRDAAALFVLDTIANAFAARQTPQGRIVLEWFRRQGRDAGRRAFAFGALVHVLEMDDLHRESVTHPACVVIPAAFAVAEQSGLDGRAFLDAVLAGYEAVCRIGNAVGRAHYKIWHNTATCGAFGSAMAVATLRGLDEQATVDALGNAGTQASGLWQFLEEGAMSKHLHAGRAAESGLLAADLAALGFTGPAAILEGRKGFFVAACPDAVPERVLAEAKAPWQLHRTSIKPWPSCRHTHPAIAAALEVRARLGGTPIERVRIETYRAALDLCDNASPTSEYEAKFSLHHCVAAAFSDGAVTLGSFDASARERLAPLRARCAAIATDAFSAAYPDRWGARVEATTAAGESVASDMPAAKGDPELPLTTDEMRAKAAMLFAHAGLSAAEAEALTSAVLALPGGAPLPRLDALLG